jgi:predicted DNA-binding transcriptional regulator YafY
MTVARQSYRQARRLFRLVELVRGHADGVALTALAAQLRVTKPQVRRDLIGLQRAGMKLEIRRQGRSSVVFILEDHLGWLPVTRREHEELMQFLKALRVERHEDNYPAAAAFLRKMGTVKFDGSQPKEAP